ncbi:MAG TPA: hypothetical protein ENN55_00930, partial [Firmicutes bacterium]|nr:hypothetical protein [Bacillota bacterium]
MKRIREIFSFKRFVVYAGAAVFMMLPVFVFSSSGKEVSGVAVWEKTTDIFAYDPVERVFIYREKASEMLAGKENKLRVPGGQKEKGGIKEYRLSGKEAALAAKALGRELDVPRHTKASASWKRVDDDTVRVELNDKEDGLWYRLRAKIPEGRNVSRVIRDDGLEIVNSTYIDRETGEVHGDLLWYMEGDTLYFYDDPVSGYSVVLSPPQPNFSILVGEAINGAGQLSLIAYPYNGEALIGGTTSIDHLGRTGDNNIGQNIDVNAGGKMALRFTSGANTYQYGNPGTSVTRNFTHVSSTDYKLHTTPE